MFVSAGMYMFNWVVDHLIKPVSLKIVHSLYDCIANDDLIQFTYICIYIPTTCFQCGKEKTKHISSWFLPSCTRHIPEVLMSTYLQVLLSV